MTKIDTVIATASCRICAQVREFAANESGATAVEYALVASGIAVAVAGTVYALGSSVKGLFTTVSTAY